MIYAVIGLGKFGLNVAKDLLAQNAHTIIVDKNEKVLNDFKSLAQEVYILDSTDAQALRESGISNVDIAVVSIGENVEASILTVMALKEDGVKEIIAKAITPVHGAILAKIGVSRVIYPERDSAKRLVKSLIQHPTCQVQDITNTIKTARVSINTKLSGLNVGDILHKMKNTINIVAIKENEMWNYHVQKDDVINGETILLIGTQEGIEEFIRIYVK